MEDEGDCPLESPESNDQLTTTESGKSVSTFRRSNEIAKAGEWERTGVTSVLEDLHRFTAVATVRRT